MSSQYKFEIKRIVLVDSAGFCFVELPVDEHAILLADGNVGKSSILNSLRLFLLPENNFKNSKNKFAFSTPKNDGFYDNEESYQHYFPSKYSCLILEVCHQYAGVESSHCQILHASSGYLSYSRIFTPLAFDEIRHLFWQLDGDEDGIGYRVNSLSSGEIFKSLKSLHKDTLTVKDNNKLRELLYANEQLVPENMRYSVFPLAESDDARIESLRTLVLLLFEMNSGSATVARAVANIIEADKKFSGDELDFNIEEFLGKHDELKAQEQELVNIANLMPNYQNLAKKFAQYCRFQKADKDFSAFYLTLTKQLIEHKKQQQEYALAFNNAQTELNGNKNYLRDIGIELKVSEKEQAKLTAKQANLEKSLDKAKLLLSAYVDTPVSDIIEMFNDDIADMKKDLLAHQDDAASERRIGELKQKIQSNELQQKNLTNKIAREEFSLSKQLSKEAWQVIASVNKRMALANPGKVLTAEQVDGFTAFTKLFEINNDGFTLFDEVFAKQSQTIVDDSALRLSDVESELLADKKSLSLLEQSKGNALTNASEIKRLTRDIKLAEDELALIKMLEVNNVIYHEQGQELETCNYQVTQLLAQQQTAQQTARDSQEQVEQAKTKRDFCNQQLNNLVQLNKHAEQIKTRYPRCQQAVDKLINENSAIELSEAVLNNIEDQLHSLGALSSDLQQGLANFVHENIIVNQDDILSQAPSFAIIRHAFDALEDVYNNLGARQTMLNEQVFVHNESVQSYMHLLQQNFDYIKGFEASLNRDFSHISINDLDAISVEIHIDKRFENLVLELANVDLYAEQLVSDNFYARLRAFASSGIFAKSSQRLTMDKIIANLSYKTRKQDQTQWQTKQQSNSTTALINLKLVQILLKRLRASGYDLMLPLVLDEVATVDVKQFDWLLNDIKTSGFNLFAASTHSASSQLIYKIGRYHEIGAMRTEKPYSKERTLVYWGGAEYLSPITEIDEAQLSFLDIAENADLAEQKGEGA
jgi:GTPase SAR1 family protein